MSNKLQTLREQIKKQLDLCDKTDTPAVCAMKETPKGEDEIIELVLQKVLYGTDISIANAIVEIENTYNINSVDQ